MSPVDNAAAARRSALRPGTRPQRMMLHCNNSLPTRAHGSLNRSINRSVDLSRAVSHVLEGRIREAREHYLDRLRRATERARQVQPRR